MKKFALLNVFVSPINYEIVLQKISLALRKKKRIFICVANVHSLMECQKSSDFRKGYNKADVITPDGMPLVWLAKLYGYKKTSRVYGPVLMQKMCALAEEKNYSIFLVGRRKEQLSRLKKRLQFLYPKLRIVGEKENQKIPFQINVKRADIVFVGLGCPLQERWMIDQRKKISAPVLVGVGAAFDFIVGDVKQAPKWIQQIGMEWLFRLFQDPNRLWYRYTITNTLFIWKITHQLLHDFLYQKIFPY